MPEHEVTSPPDAALREDATAREAARVLADERCDSAVVVGADGSVRGLVTEEGLLTGHFSGG